MNQADKARLFKGLHVKGDPLILYNIWDAGSAKAVAAAGAKAVATGSWSLAAAHGFSDGEAIPLDFVAEIAGRIAAAVDVPLTVDFESGYHREPKEIARNAALLMETDAVGVNFEDQIVGGEGLYDAVEQGERIGAIRREAEARKLPFFINARTDLFLKSKREAHADLIAEAKMRARAYAEAGASGLFAPGLADERLIEDLCAVSPIPVNIMMLDGAPKVARLAALGVARVSYGPIPFVKLMASLEEQAREAFRRP